MNDIFSILKKSGALITNDHFVYTSGKHGSEYVNKDAVYTNPDWLDELCRLLAVQFAGWDIDVVVAPAVGGVNLTTSVTRSLRSLTGKDIRAIYSEHDELSLMKAEDAATIDCRYSDGQGIYARPLAMGDELLIRPRQFVIKRGYDKLLAGGKRVLVVEDVLTTGGSARETVRAARKVGGEVAAVAALCNRGNVMAEYLEVPELFALVDVQMKMYDEAECPLCAAGVPINTQVGKGKAFLARKSQSA